MNEEKDEWAEEIFQSMKGSKRSKPSPELLSKIESQIAFSNIKIVPRLQWRYAAVAAILILLLNTTALIYYKRHQQMKDAKVAVVDTYERPLIRSYQIYE